MTERCWFNKFSPDAEQCAEPGVWFDPEATSTVLSAMRWCDQHKHYYDEPTGDHACEFDVFPCPRCGEDGL